MGEKQAILAVWIISILTVLYEGKLFIGADDGFLCIGSANG